MEKLIAVNLNTKDADNIYKICSQMKIQLIVIEQDQMLLPIEKLLSHSAYRPGQTNQRTSELTEPLGIVTKPSQKSSLVILCDMSEKHIDKLLATLRLGETKVTYKAVLTSTNRKWNALRMLAEMELEKRSYDNL